MASCEMSTRGLTGLPVGAVHAQPSVVATSPRGVVASTRPSTAMAMEASNMPLDDVASSQVQPQVRPPSCVESSPKVLRTTTWSPAGPGAATR